MKQEEIFKGDRFIYGIDVLMILWLYTYLQTHQVVYIKCV